MYNGMITIYKEPGYTSSDVVAKMRGILHMKKIGHTGTLDPAAEGVLPVCLGNGTKLASLIENKKKEYVAVMRLGVKTDTQDMTGQILQSIPDDKVREAVTEKKLLDTLKHFTGKIGQIPPMYSALWQNGKRLYELAREGKIVERSKREVTIFELELLDVDLPLVTMRVVCSKGTYIRTLCEDIGEALGTGGAMEHLERTRVGIFTEDRALKLKDLERMMKENPGEVEKYILPIDFFFEDCPAVHVEEGSFPYLNNGNPLSFDNLIEKDAVSQEIRQREKTDPGAFIRVYSHSGEFYGVYRWSVERNRMICVRMFHKVAGDTRKNV